MVDMVVIMVEVMEGDGALTKVVGEVLMVVRIKDMVKDTAHIREYLQIHKRKFYHPKEIICTRKEEITSLRFFSLYQTKWRKHQLQQEKTTFLVCKTEHAHVFDCLGHWIRSSKTKEEELLAEFTARHTYNSTCPTYLMVLDIGSDPQKQKKKNFWQN